MITGFVQGQVLRLSAPVVAADTLDYLTAQFVFRSADWNGMEKWAHFAKGGTVYDIPLTEDKIRREDHLNLGAGEWKVYVHGNRFAGGTVVERITTAEDVLRVVPTGALNGEPFPEMPASVTEQILARLEDVEQNGGGSGDGYSPEAKVERVDGGVRVTITDKDGTTSEVVQDGKPGVHVGSDAPPAGTKVWVNPSGKRPEIPQVDDTLTQPGYAADAAKVGEKFDQLSGAKADYASVPNKATVDGSTLKMQRETTTTDEAGTETTETTDLFEVELPPGGEGWTIDGLTAEAVIADDDAVPFYDTSAKGQRKTLWSNIKAVLKTYFDTVYLKRSGGTLTGKIALPTDNQNVGFTNSWDTKIFGYGNVNSVSHLRVGDAERPLQLRGSTERPKYNDGELVLKSEFDTVMQTYIDDIAELVGGDA